MHIHEYQSRQLLEQYGVPVPAGIVVESADQAAQAFEELKRSHGAECAVIKAQIHAGGRGKGGGVKLVSSGSQARDAARRMLIAPLVTPQTGPQGVPVRQLLVAAGVKIAREFYLGLTVDRARASPVLIASAEGGVEIEQIAQTNPKAILREHLSPLNGLRPYQARKVAYRLGLRGPLVREAVRIMQRLGEVFLSKDASLLEINPLVVTTADPPDHPEGRLMALDAKINFDDNAMFRHQDIQAYERPSEHDPSEVAASRVGLSYIKLDGQIGCLVNGAGLAMSTMDIIKLHGGEPANFLDVGGGAGEEAVTEGFRIILADPKVKGVLVNIFGGIMKCDVIAAAIANAARQVGFTVPLVVRLEGTNVDPALAILEKAKKSLPTMTIGTDLTDAANKITAAVRQESKV